MLTSTGEYALRAIVFLAQQEGKPQTSAVVAEATKVPHGYLSKILKQLVKKDLITSQRGIHGGFVLVRAPKEISVLDVLEAIDSAPARIHKCPLGISDHHRLCPLHKVLDDSMALTEKAYASTTLDSLSKSARGIKPLCRAK